MKVQGQHTFDAPRATVWKAVMNPEVIAKVMPNCEALETVGENTYEGAMKIKVGPVQGLFKGRVEVSDLNEPESYHLKIKGKGAPGFVEAAGLIKLAEEGGKTALDYEFDAKIGGRIASVGQRLLESSTKVISRQSLEGLAAQIEAIQEAGEGAEPVPAAAPSQAKLAAGFALGLVEEMIPPAARPIAGIGLGGGIGVVLIGLLYLIFKACSGS
jgi:carbon monoxide dehydrogenase subunit G